MKKFLGPLMLLFLLIAALPAFGQKKHTFEIKGGNFVYDGKAVQIHSGEMHYARIPHQYWRHRFQMIKAMGLNTVATYVFWNLHETEPGKWDFTGDKNLAEYIKTADPGREAGCLYHCPHQKAGCGKDDQCYGDGY